MKINQDIKVAVDAVVFGYSENTLQVLLIKQRFGEAKGKWSLPGGFVLNDESLDQAVKREMKEETGLRTNFLEQLYSFGAVNRDNRFRVVTVAYLGLVNPKNYTLSPTTDASDAKWFPVKSIPRLAFDHKKIITLGLNRLRSKLNYQPVGFELLRSQFSFSELEQLYQTILEKSIDRRNFRKKILSFGLLDDTGILERGNSGRPAKLYSFNKKQYKLLEKEGYQLDIRFV